MKCEIGPGSSESLFGPFRTTMTFPCGRQHAGRDGRPSEAMHGDTGKDDSGGRIEARKARIIELLDLETGTILDGYIDPPFFDE
ncbi:MAG: hypothetical protein AB9903_00925 [Vulcanimicrobiota bacterium]